MQISTIKLGNLKNQTFAHSKILSIWLSSLPFNNINKIFNNLIYMYDFRHCIIDIHNKSLVAD